MKRLSGINSPLVWLDFIALEEYVEFKVAHFDRVDLQKNNSSLSIGAMGLIPGVPD